MNRKINSSDKKKSTAPARPSSKKIRSVINEKRRPSSTRKNSKKNKTEFNDEKHASATPANELDRNKPVTEEQKLCFVTFLRYALTIGVPGILQEFQEQLKGYSPPNVTRFAFDANTDRNRYKDVICIDSSRVALRNGPEYIHANYVRGEPLVNAFICTQGPMVDTVKDFWRMIIQEKACNIIMLCETVELGKEKCQQYWPREEGCVIEWPGITIRNMKVDTSDSTTVVCTLEVEVDRTEKIVLKHFQWRTWPDRSVPQSVLAPFRLLSQARHRQNPTVVHCSAGVGRTGTVVALEMCLQQILSEQPLSVTDVVKKLRAQRMHCVQTDLQLVYIYKCLITFAYQHATMPEEFLIKMKEFDMQYGALLQERSSNEGKQAIAQFIEIVRLLNYSTRQSNDRASMIRGSLSSFRRILTNRNIFQLPVLQFSSKRPPGPNQKFYDNLNVRIENYQRELWKHARSSFKSRHIKTSIVNLRQAMEEVKTKHDVCDFSQLIPSLVSLEVLSNGTTHKHPSVVIRTPHKVYMFNCPEGSSRFLPQLRLKSLNVSDIFITTASWSNIGGIAGVLLSKERTTEATRLHGPYSVKNYLDCIRPFTDSDFGTSKYPSRVDEHTYDMEKFEDHILAVRYLPLTDMLHSSQPNNLIPVPQTDVAFLVTLKEAPRRIDPNKLIVMQVPKGPLISKLKSGETVILPDGREIQPDDVLMERVTGADRPNALIVELNDISMLSCLKDNSNLQPFVTEKRVMNFIVHYTAENILNTSDYRSWMDSFGPNCRHVIVNGSGPCVPHMESMHRNQILLNHVDKEFFPLLTPSTFDGLHSQDHPEDCRNQVVLAKPMQRFSMRGELGTEDPILIDLRKTELLKKFVDNEQLKKTWELYKTKSPEACTSDIYPQICFLGTSSAVPSKYRNVSGYYLELSEKSAIMVDCGEGSYGQLRVLFGEKLNEKLLNLKAIFITHAHQDHMNGLYNVIIERHRVFEKLGLHYIPLVLVCNRNVRMPLKTFSRCFYNVESLVSVVDVSNTKSSPERSKQVIYDITKDFPSDLYNAEEWNLRSANAVQVHHTRMANGYVFSDFNGKTVVFSGDTMPCDMLVEAGKGADVLIHEATFEDDHEEDAQKKKHSTMLQAVTIGEKMGAKHILLSHFSARYPKVPRLPEYLDQKANITVAMDNLIIPFGRLSASPKLIPVYRELYQEELFEIQMKREQRRIRRKEESEQPPTKKRNIESV